jgi:hypothetical protein
MSNTLAMDDEPRRKNGKRRMKTTDLRVEWRSGCLGYCLAVAPTRLGEL